MVEETLSIDGKEYRGLHVPTEKSNLLMIQGSRGFLGCGYFNVMTAEKLDEAVAIVRGVASYDDMLSASVVEVSAKALNLGVREGQSGREALAFL